MSKSCQYCGNNPVPHTVYWYNETLNVVLTPLRQRLLFNPLTRFFKAQGWDNSLARFFLWLGESLGIITRQENLRLCKVRRAQVLWEEAEKRGIKMTELLIFGRPFDVYLASRAGQLRRSVGAPTRASGLLFSGLPRPKGYLNHRMDLMDDKWWFKQEMMKHGLPVAYGRSCSSFRQAREVLRRIRESDSQKIGTSALTPLIVKPRAGSRGRHSITFIYSEADLRRAFKIAKQLCYWAMVEQQLFGPVYRATVINFELAGVLRGDSPQVTGDGAHSIKQLVEIKNQAPHPGVKNIVLDAQAETFLSRQNLNFSSVIKSGETVNLSEKIGVGYGGSSSEDFDICHSDNKELFVRAAKILGDPIVGFDFIIPDITRSYKEQTCGFLEVNTLPFINLHHDPLHGTPRNPAAKIWDMMGW